MHKTVLGWREWVGLPSLGVAAIKAKIDSGARSSALHVSNLKTVTEGEHEFANFKLMPFRSRKDLELNCKARIIGRKSVRDSGGHSEERLVIEETLVVAGNLRKIEITLTCREGMLFRLLIGRTAFKHDFLIDSSRSFLTGRFCWSEMLIKANC